MPTWNQLPDGGDWLNRSRTPLSTSSSNLGSPKATVRHHAPSPLRHSSSSSSNSKNAAEHRFQVSQLNKHLPPEDRVAIKPPARHPLPSRSISPKPSSKDWGSTNAAEHRFQVSQLNKHLPPEDRVAIKPPARHPLPSRSISPKPASKDWGSASAAEHRFQVNQLNKHLPPEDRVALTTSKPSKGGQLQPPSYSAQQKPPSKSPGIMSFNAAERRSGSEYSNIKPKPIPGSAADLPEARKELQQRRDAEQNLRKANKGGIFGAEIRDLQRETSVAQARVDASEAAKRLQDFPIQAQRSKLQNRGIADEIRSDLAQRANSAKEKYMGIQGLDVSGQPIKLIPPPALEPPKPEPEKSLWDRARDSVTEKASDAWDKTKSAGNYVKDHAETIGHTALDAGGMIPVAGAAFDGANAVWYLAKGDKVNAALSAASAVPFIGDAAMAAKYGAKAVKGAEKLAEVGNVVHKTTNVVDEGVVSSSVVSRVSKTGSTPLRDTRGRYVSNPNSPLTQAKHKSPEYKAAQVQLKRETIDDPKAPKYIRAWLKQERMRRGDSPRNWRNPPGYDTGHSDPSDNTQLRWETSSQNRSRGARFGR